MSRDQKKHEKKIKRRKRGEEKQQHEADRELRLRRRAEFPDIIFEGRADPSFEGLVRKAVSELSFDSPKFEDWERTVYRALKWGGRDAALFARDQYRQHSDIKAKVGCVEKWFTLNFGHQVFSMIGPAIEKHLHWNDVHFTVRGNCIVGVFRCLEKQPSEGGTIYYSLQRPKVTFGSQQFIVGYSLHAIKRITERVERGWKTYGGHGNAFYFFHQCKHIVTGVMRNLNGGFGPCISLFEPLQVDSPHIRTRSLERFGDLVDDDGSGLYLRIGYCTVVLDGQFAIATTFEPPGYRDTPEAAVYRDRDFPYEFRDAMRQLGRAENAGGGVFHADPDLVGIFHMLGFPQVIRGSDPCFAHLNTASSP